MRRKAQSWSIDIVIAVVVFGFVTMAIAGFVLLSKPDIERLEQNSQLVIVNLAATQAGCDQILSGNEVDMEQLTCLFNTSYQDFRRDNNIQGDFCIYLEDEQGRVWPVNERYGWGSSDLRISGFECDPEPTP